MGVEVLAVLLSTGAAGMLLAIAQAYRALKVGARADERDHIEMTEDRRRIAETDRDRAIEVANYWRARAGALEYVLLSKVGPTALPTFPPEPRLFTNVTDTKTEAVKGMTTTIPNLPDITTE